MRVTRETLAEVAALHGLAPQTLERVAQSATLLACAPGDAFYQQGDPPAGFFALQTGRVKLYRHSGEKAQILAILLPGDCFGAESLPDEAPCPWTAEAMEASTAIYLATDRLRPLMAACPDLQVALLELVSSRLRQFVTLVHDLAFRDVAARLAAVLLARAEAEGAVTAAGVQIRRAFSQQELAAMVGTAREVVYRTFRQFERDGLLKLSRSHILILDMARLAEVARRETR
ncbi:MAG: Crp/Fnr family transcriptional regulator [Anaerolineae bacterium]